MGTSGAARGSCAPLGIARSFRRPRRAAWRGRGPHSGSSLRFHPCMFTFTHACRSLFYLLLLPDTPSRGPRHSRLGRRRRRRSIPFGSPVGIDAVLAAQFRLPARTHRRPSRVRGASLVFHPESTSIASAAGHVARSAESENPSRGVPAASPVPRVVPSDVRRAGRRSSTWVATKQAQRIAQSCAHGLHVRTKTRRGRRRGWATGRGSSWACGVVAPRACTSDAARQPAARQKNDGRCPDRSIQALRRRN